MADKELSPVTDGQYRRLKRIFTDPAFISAGGELRISIWGSAEPPAVPLEELVLSKAHYSPEIATVIDDVTERFGIAEFELWRYLVLGGSDINLPLVFADIETVAGKEYLVIRAPKDIRLEQLEKQWPAIKRVQAGMKGYKPRTKNIKNEDRDTAIMRAKDDNWSYKRILRALEAGTLPGFGKVVEFADEDAIKKIVRRRRAEGDT